MAAPSQLVKGTGALFRALDRLLQGMGIDDKAIRPLVKEIIKKSIKKQDFTVSGIDKKTGLPKETPVIRPEGPEKVVTPRTLETFTDENMNDFELLSDGTVNQLDRPKSVTDVLERRMRRENIKESFIDKDLPPASEVITPGIGHNKPPRSIDPGADSPPKRKVIEHGPSFEERLDQIQQELLDEGTLEPLATKQELTRFGDHPTRTSPGDFESSTSQFHKRLTRDEAENIENYLNLEGAEQLPRKMPKGLFRKPSSDDIDMIGARRENQLRLIEEQLRKQGLDTPENLKRAKEDIEIRDINDLTAKQIYGREGGPKIEAGEENVSIRDFEDLFDPPRYDKRTGQRLDPTSERGQLVRDAKARATAAIHEAQRSQGPDIVPQVPVGQHNIDRVIRASTQPLEAPIAELTGPLNKESRNRLLEEMQRRATQRAGLKTLRTGEAQRVPEIQAPSTIPGRQVTAPSDAALRSAADTPHLSTKEVSTFDPAGEVSGKELQDLVGAAPDANVRLIEDIGEEFRREALSKQRIIGAQQGPPTNLPASTLGQRGTGKTIQTSRPTPFDPSNITPTNEALPLGVSLESMLQELLTQPQEDVLLDAIKEMLLKGK